MKVIIAGGGTGGHLFPGLALAQEFKRRDPGGEVIFVGTEQGIEARVVPREGYPIRFIRARGFVGKSLVKKAAAAVTLLVSLLDSYRILRLVNPDIVLGVGGYASGAFVIVARLLSIPTMIHEQNSVPGLTNKILSRFVGCVCATYHESLPAFPAGRAFLTGNPVRPRILRGDRESACRLFSLDSGLFTVFVFGGSSGAKAINRVMVDAMNHLGDLREKVQFLHQTGERDYENIRDAYRKAGVRGTVTPFVYQMAEAYAAADVVISRAGATTLAELTAIGKAAILIPYPHAAGRHQEFNALKLRELGAALVIHDHEMSGEIIADHIRRLFENESQRKDMERISRGLGRPDACGRIVDIAFSLVKNRPVKRHREGVFSSV